MYVREYIQVNIRESNNVITVFNFICRDLLDEAKDYHLMPERRSLLQSFRTRPRCCNYIMGHIFAVGGLTKSGNFVIYTI